MARFDSETLTLDGSVAHEVVRSRLLSARIVSAAVAIARWGDYSGAATDPSDSSVWVAGEYADTPDIFFGSIWGTAIARVQP